MAVGQETGKKEENLSATVLRTLKGESEGIRHVFLTYESSNAAKHWGSVCRKNRVGRQHPQTALRWFAGKVLRHKG